MFEKIKTIDAITAKEYNFLQLDEYEFAPTQFSVEMKNLKLKNQTMLYLPNQPISMIIDRTLKSSTDE